MLYSLYPIWKSSVFYNSYNSCFHITGNPVIQNSNGGLVQTHSSLSLFFLLWQTHDYSAIHQPASCLTESIPHTAAPSCLLSARFPDWSVVSAGCQTPYPRLHHSERAELPGVSQENPAGELFSPCCPPLPHAISPPFSFHELHWKEKRWYPSNYRGVSA